MYVRALYVLYLLYLLYLLLNYIASSHSTKFNVNTAARVADCARVSEPSTYVVYMWVGNVKVEARTYRYMY